MADERDAPIARPQSIGILHQQGHGPGARHLGKGTALAYRSVNAVDLRLVDAGGHGASRCLVLSDDEQAIGGANRQRIQQRRGEQRPGDGGGGQRTAEGHHRYETRRRPLPQPARRETRVVESTIGP